MQVYPCHHQERQYPKFAAAVFVLFPENAQESSEQDNAEHVGARSGAGRDCRNSDDGERSCDRRTAPKQQSDRADACDRSQP